MGTWAEMHVRVGAILHQVADDHASGLVVVVAHGGTVGASFIALGQRPIADGVLLTPDTRNASITERLLQNDTWRLARYNDTAHLA